MIKITDALATEHAVFLTVFDQIEQILPKIASTEEATRFSALIKGLLENHAGTEDSMVYVALDHALANKGQLTHLHQEHQEIDTNLEKVHTAKGLPEARQLLKAAIKSSRAHFASEEHHVFPVLENVLGNETLVEMGKNWAQKRK